MPRAVRFLSCVDVTTSLLSAQEGEGGAEDRWRGPLHSLCSSALAIPTVTSESVFSPGQKPVFNMFLANHTGPAALPILFRKYVLNKYLWRKDGWGWVEGGAYKQTDGWVEGWMSGWSGQWVGGGAQLKGRMGRGITG